MQKLIAKYGTAAHLAILAVAPLFLFPFFGDEVVATVLMWLTFFGAWWVLLEPSIRPGEMLHNARARVARNIVRDPFFWASLVLIAIVGVRALNGGISLAYDAEISKWHVSDADFPLLPGVVGSAGNLPFAAVLATMVIIQGARHSMGRSARLSFLLVVSALSGIAAIVALILFLSGNQTVADLMACKLGASSFIGMTFGLILLASTVAVFAAFENHWNLSMLFVILAICGSTAGLFMFSPIYVIIVMAGAEVLLLLYTFLVACKSLQSSGEFKLLVVTGIAFVLGVLLIMVVMPEAEFKAKLGALKAINIFPDDFLERRVALSRVALNSWLQHLWIGTGIGSFSLDFRFAAEKADWLLFPRGATAAMNGWWTILAERGVVGVMFIAVPFGFLMFTYLRRMVGAIVLRKVPHPACILGPIAILALGATSLFDGSFMRAEVLMLMGAFLAISANAFPKVKKGK